MAALHPYTTRNRRRSRPPSYTTLWGTTDFRIDIKWASNNKIAHHAEQYLAHPAVGMLVADALHPPVDVPVTGAEIALRIDDVESDALFTLSYGSRVASKITKRDAAARYEDTLKVLGEYLRVWEPLDIEVGSHRY